MEEIKIPEGAKSMTCNVEGNKVILEFIHKKEFKDGDILACGQAIVIYNSTTENAAIICYGGLNTMSHTINFFDKPDRGFGYIDNYRYATEEKKQKLFDAMAKEGLKWNAEKKRVERERWRAEHLGYYYFICSELTARKSCESNDRYDNIRYDSGNYFKTIEEAERKVSQIKEILKGD